MINPQNRTFKVKAELDNMNGAIMPNAIASLKIQDYQSNHALVLPSEVIKKDMRGDFVFIAQEAKAHKVYIEVGRSYKDKTEVLEGLSEGDQIITAGYNEVANRSKIQIKK